MVNADRAANVLKGEQRVRVVHDAVVQLEFVDLAADQRAVVGPGRRGDQAVREAEPRAVVVDQPDIPGLEAAFAELPALAAAADESPYAGDAGKIAALDANGRTFRRKP